MIDRKNVHSLSDFRRNAKAHIRRLKKTGKLQVLTVKGEAELVVQSAEAYQQLLDAADIADSVDILRRHIAKADRGAKGLPAKRALPQIKKRIEQSW
jgi:PHD/YefM family antitoxin component YafN of YafNO toxin-antitoxin module